MHNECNEQVIVSELSKILERARGKDKESNREFVFVNNNIPLTSTRIVLPKVYRRDTSIYDNWH